MNTVVEISDSRARELLDWSRIFEATERAMASVAKDLAFQSPRSIIRLPNSNNLMFLMSGYLQDSTYGALAQKLFTVFPGNPKRTNLLPVMFSRMTLLDEETGVVKAIIDAEASTEWRTAAASVVATKYLHGKDSGKENKVLAILGAGAQGKAHTLALQHYFQFKEVRVWNRTPQRATNLVNELNHRPLSTGTFRANANIEECVRGADVIVTATTSEATLVKSEWVKKGAHINAIGVSHNILELDADIYRTSDVYIDHWDGAKVELSHIAALGVEFKCQVGDLIAGLVKPPPGGDNVTVFQSLVHISEDRVRQLLRWDKTFEVTERAMESVARARAFQSSRPITPLPNSPNLMFTMPGYLSDDKCGALGCKLVTYFPNNSTRDVPLPSIMANILLMDDETGALKAVVAGTEITTWRTAAASAVATKYLHGANNKILAIMGAGTQGRIHAIAFQHFFNFQEVRIWNHRPERARNVAAELNEGRTGGMFVACENAEDCVKDADVIVTATSGDKPVVKFEWLKKGAHINAVGVGASFELDEAIYKAANVYIDYWDGAKTELGTLRDLGVEFKGQVGDLIAGTIPKPDLDTLTVFQSLGMAVEDCAMARLIYDLHMESAT